MTTSGSVNMDTIEQMVSMLLGGAVETLDISPDTQQLAVDTYEEVGTWLAENGGDRFEIYPQGSFRLGTVVRPSTPSGEYDIDLVCWVQIAKESTTQALLKQRIGDHLHDYLRWKVESGHGDGPATCEPSRRCWTLGYPSLGFHLDVLPAVPDLDHLPTGILLTDKELREWQYSNPIGYAEWFRGRSEEMLDQLFEKALARHANVGEVPTWEVRSTLQRLVQVLKWHAMMFFANDPDNRPPSILITTLAARAYRGERDLFTATRSAVSGMDEFIEDRHGTWWVTNPAHDGENFADKWNYYPERRDAFIAWHRDITTLLDDLSGLTGRGLPVVAARMAKSLGSDVVAKSAERYGDALRQQSKDGLLRMTNTGLLTTSSSSISVPLRRHTFHGQTAAARD